jgi:hypothetical protein
MVQPLNPDSWDSEGNLLVPRYGIRIAIRLALLAAGAYWLFTLLEDKELRRLNPLQPSAFPHSAWVTTQTVPDRARPCQTVLLGLIGLTLGNWRKRRSRTCRERQIAQAHVSQNATSGACRGFTFMRSASIGSYR